MSISDAIAFLSTPYEANPDGVEAAYHAALDLTARLAAAQPIAIFSPVVFCHPLALKSAELGGPGPLDREFWMEFIRPYMRLSTMQIVGRLPNWENSDGIAHETGYFETANKPVFDIIDLGRLTMVNRERLKPARDRYDGSISVADLDRERRDYLGHAPR